MKKLLFFLSLILISIPFVFSSYAIENGDVIYFGTYPQSLVTDQALTEALSSCDLQWQSYDFYSGTGEIYDGKMTASNICEYADICYDSINYRAVRINNYRPFATSDPAEEPYSYQEYNGFMKDQIYFFQYEDVKWKVIDTDKNLIITDQVLDSQSFNNTVFCDADDEGFFINESKEVAADNYLGSSLAEFLENDFSSTAFSEDEATNLSISPAPLDANIFKTLSEKLIQSEATAYAKIMGIFLSDDKPCWWINNSLAGAWISNGLGEAENLNQDVNFSGIGIRPMVAMTSLKCNHKFKTVTTKATTTKNGSIVKSCTACGYVESSTAINMASDISLSSTSLTYTGSKLLPTVNVKDSKGKKLSTSYYTVTYSNSSAKSIGKYTITVKLKGNYSGTKTLSYKIVPEKVLDLKIESTKVGKVSLSWSSAKGASAYDIYVSTSKDGTYTLNKSTTSKSTTISNLTPGKKYYIKVRGYKKVDDVKYSGSFSSVKSISVNDGSIAIKNGKLYKENGISYIKDTSTGVKFIIVNKTYSIPSNYAPGGLTKECNSAFNKLIAAAKKDGITIKSISGYRSYSYQNTLYNNYVSRDGKANADKYSARPGHSEHQTGLAIDCNSLKSSFADTKEGKWLAKHCAEYGFIIRYGSTKISSTGYQYEPWHIRYMGSVDLAKKLTSSGKSIEEYYGITSKY